MSLVTTASVLRELVGRHWPGAPAFFETVKPERAAPRGFGFRAAFASVPRRLATVAQAPIVAPAELARVARSHWTLTDYTRAALLAECFEVLPRAEQPDVVLHFFEAGELGEQVSLLRALALWDEPVRFLETGLQACRTNAQGVFEAIVCENAFLAAHFPALNFNQAVMKAIFMQVALARVEGLETRITPELQRMAAGYASERRAAGRPVPLDADYLVHYGE